VVGGREDPRGEKPKRAWGSFFEMNNLRKGIRLQTGKKSLERRVEVATLVRKAQERKGDGKPSFDRAEERSSEGKSPRALKVEIDHQG